MTTMAFLAYTANPKFLNPKIPKPFGFIDRLASLPRSGLSTLSTWVQGLDVQELPFDMSYSLNSLKWLHRGLYRGVL